MLVDLNQFLRDNGLKVKGVKMYGVLKGVIEPPYPINTIPLKGDDFEFCLLDAVAFEFNNTFYWTSGQFIAPVSHYTINDAKKKPSKRLLLSLEGGRTEYSHHGIVAMYKFVKDGGVWATGKVFVRYPTREQNKELVTMLIHSAQNNWNYIYPEGVFPPAGYLPASGNFEFKYTEEWETLRMQGDGYSAELKHTAQDTNDRPLPPPPPERGQQQFREDKPQFREEHSQSRETNHNPNAFSGNTPNNQGNTYTSSGSGSPSSGSNQGGLIGSMGMEPIAMPNYNPIMAGTSMVHNNLVNKYNPEGKPSKLVLADPSLKKLDYHRSEPVEKSEFHEQYTEYYKSSMLRLEEYMAKAREYAPKYNILDTLKNLVLEGLRKHWYSSLLFNKSTEKWFTDTLLYIFEECWEGEEKPKSQPHHITDAIKNNGVGVLEAFTKRDVVFLGDATKELDEISKAIYDYSYHITLMKLEYLLDIRKGGLLGIMSPYAFGALSPSVIMDNNIYMLGLYNSVLKFENLEKLRMVIGLPVTEEMHKVRNALKCHNYLLDANNMTLASGTLHARSQIERDIKAGYTMTEAQFGVFKSSTNSESGSVLSNDRTQALGTFFSNKIKPEDLYVSKTGWERGFKTYSKTDGITSKQMIDDAIEVGIVVEIGSPLDGKEYIADVALVKKELYIYEKLYEMLDVDVPEVTEEQLTNYRKEFESMKEQELNLEEGQFRLEERQAEAGNLVAYNTGILTGGAGSGKTTTAEYLVYVAQNARGLDSKNVYFAAPTGKAAQRLAEVVKRPASTVNRLFGLGVGAFYPLGLEHRDDRKLLVPEDDTNSMLFMDESSIMNVDLLYEIMLRIDTDRTSVYFLGDDDQLPPIGFGKPFASILTFLPTVHLNVSKRASESSLITKNGNRIIDPTDTRDLEDGDDFRIINMTDAQLGLATLKNIVGYHIAPEGKRQELATTFKPITTLGQGLTSEDIQIVSPYQGAGETASVLVNRVMQEVFNPAVNQNFILTYTDNNNVQNEFRLNDKVIHGNPNLAKRSRYVYDERTRTFTLQQSKGVYNGDIGYIRGFFSITDLNLSTGDVSEDKISEEEVRLHKIVNAEKQRFLESGQPPLRHAYYVAVEYQGVDDAGVPLTYYVLYMCTEVNRQGKYMQINLLELKMLSLAYCLSTHKLQGSQASLVICLYFPNGSKKSKRPFVSRNMLYTGVTRAKKGLYGLGDFYGPNSVVNLGRKYQANSSRSVLFDIY